MITRWQAARGYPKSGYLNALQHKALQSEICDQKLFHATTTTGGASARRTAAGWWQSSPLNAARGGGPGALFGGMMRPLFGR